MQVNMEVPTDGPLDLEVLFSFHKEDAYLVSTFYTLDYWFLLLALMSATI